MMKRIKIGCILGWLTIALWTLPVLYTVWISFSPDAFLTPPTGAWSLKWYLAMAADHRWANAAVRSLAIGAAAAALSCAAATMAVLALRRRSGYARRIATVALLLPAVVPPAALGTGLLPLAYRTGLWGTATGVALVHAALGLPAATLIIGSFLNGELREVEQAAQGLGASRWGVRLRITFPLLRPAMLAACIAVFLISLNESLVTLFLATPDNETLPALIWPQLRFSTTPLVAAASSLTGVLGIACIALFFWGFRSNRQDD